MTIPSATSAPSSGADGGRQEVVRDPLEREHLDEMPAARADRARDAELSSPLGGEHHEDQEDQEDARGDRERAERREEGHERVSGRIRVLDRVRLERLDLEVQRRATGWSSATTSSESAAPATSPPRFETRTALISPAWP